MSKPLSSRASSALTLILILAVVAGAAVAVFYFSRPVAKVAPVTSGLAIKAVPGSVTVFAEHQMELKSESGGRVLKSRLDPGLHVKEGEFLVQIDTGDLDLEPLATFDGVGLNADDFYAILVQDPGLVKFRTQIKARLSP